jgi:hypothetical protein
MRSQLIFNAMTHVPNRYQLARVLSMATRNFHRPGTRIADTMNDVLVRFASASPIAATNDESHQSAGISALHRRPHSSWDSGAQAELQRIAGDQTGEVVGPVPSLRSCHSDSQFLH